MYADTASEWRADVKWLAAILLVVAVAAATLFTSFAQLAAPERAEPLLEQVLTLTLVPGEGAALEVREGLDYDPTQPLALLPGVTVFADPTEVPTLDVDASINRIAGVLADRFVVGGAPAVSGMVNDPLFSEQLTSAFAGPVRVLIDAHLSDALLPAGLDDGSRIAAWPLQAQQNPGEPVQPVVGVFVYAEPSTLAALSDRQVGELVIDRLADLVRGAGLAAAQEAITNVNLETRLTTAVERDVRGSLHETFAALLTARRPQIESRLEQARAAIAAQGEEPSGIAGVLSAEELAGLSDEERTERVIAALAERAWLEGGAALLPLLEDAEQSQRLASVVPLLDGASQAARGRYLRWAWLAGGAALLLLLILVAASRGWGRLVNPGVALALAAAGGAGLAYTLSRSLGSLASAPLPLSVRTEGVFAHLLGLLVYIGVNLPQQALEVLLRNHLAVLVVGVGLVVLALVVRLMRLVRPRRRSLL